MSDKYSRSLLRISVAQICQNLGWNSAQNSSLEVLTDVLERYILKIGETCHKFTEQYGRTEANLDDLGLAFEHLGISVAELENYVHHVDPVPFAHEVIAFPAPKPSSLTFPNPRSREVLQHREEHIPDHMPYMFPNMKDEIPVEKTASPLNGTVSGLDAASKAELSQGNDDREDSNVGDKRSAAISTPDLPPSKRPRLGNLPEEAGHSQYEMTCVFMGPNGVLTTRQGCQGRLPEARMPPPNPRTLIELANKENSGKTKDSAGGPKISINIGGIGTESLTSSKNDGKKSKKSLQKRKLFYEQGKSSSKELVKELTKKSFTSKMSADGLGKELGKKLVSKAVMDGMGKELGKKSVSSKAAAKFLKKLKMSKKSSKLFSKSKIKDGKVNDVFKENGFPERSKKLLVQTNSEDGRKKKEKKSAEFVDTDEELRNLSSPSSRVPSPEQPLVIDTEGGVQMKARLEAISDSINSVLRDPPAKDGKVKKRRKKEGKVDDSSVNGTGKSQDDGKVQEVKIKRKPGRPPKVQKPPEPPPPVDVKPFVSDKYSSAELQVYEFNDSPPDTSISSRRPSAAESVAPPPPPPPPPPQPVVKHEPPAPTAKSSGSSSKFHRRVQPEDDLFAPEIKIESRVDHSETQAMKKIKLEQNKEKEKPKIKVEKTERDEPEKMPQKSKDLKGDRLKDRKDKYQEHRERLIKDKEKQKEKEHRKDKKEKKKEKEKKKKHKVREHDRDKEKEKRPEEKVKQEARESRESSPAIGVGVKLKIKIGGGAGTPTSMMVTGEGSSPASPVPNFGLKRESMSPPRVVPKIYISKKGQGTEEKPKKSSKSSSQHGEGSKHKPSALAKSSKSQSASQPASPSSSKTSPSPRSTPTPPVPRKTPTPPPSAKPAHRGHHPPHSKVSSSKPKDVSSSVPAKQRQSRSPVKDRASKTEKKKRGRKDSLSSLSSASSSSPSPPAKPLVSKRQTPPRLERMSTSPERSPPPLPFQSRTPSPRPPSSAARSRSRTSSPHRSLTPPPSLSRRRFTLPPALSPREQYHSPSPTRPPTPGSTSPPPSPELNLPVSSPLHPRSPTPTPRTPTASPLRNIPSPHLSLPGSPIMSHRSPSPEVSSRPGSRLMDSPEPKAHPRDNPSPASSGKSSSSLSKPSRTVEAETVCVFYDDSGQKVWICPSCKLPDDGSEMIGCDMCDNWYHWPCVGITQAPPEEQQWFCVKCFPKTKTSGRGRGRPRGRGRGRGRKKIT